MILLSLDLEMNQPSGKIIQIGACIGNLYTGEVLDTFSSIVKIDEPLTEFIIKLTGISEEDMQAGFDLLEAYEALLIWKNKYKLDMCNPLTWGGGDSIELKAQIDAFYVPRSDWPFGRRWLDVKTLFQFRQMGKQRKVQAGLAKALTKCKLNFKGSKHNAKDDAINTFLLAHYLLANDPVI